MVRNLPCNAQDASFIPGQRTQIPHATGQPSSRASTRVRVLETRVHAQWGPATAREAHAPQQKIPQVATKTRRSQNGINKCEKNKTHLSQDENKPVRSEAHSLESGCLGHGLPGQERISSRKIVSYMAPELLKVIPRKILPKEV